MASKSNPNDEESLLEKGTEETESSDKKDEYGQAVVLDGDNDVTMVNNEYRFYTRHQNGGKGKGNGKERVFSIAKPVDFPLSAWYWGGLAVRIAAIRAERLSPRQEDQAMRKIVDELGPFLLEETGYELQYYRECSNKTNNNRRFFSLLRSPAADLQQHSTIAATKEAPKWDCKQEEDGDDDRSEVHIHVWRPWWMLSKRGVSPFVATALKGHKAIDVFTWGLLYSEIEPLIWKGAGGRMVWSIGGMLLAWAVLLVLQISEDNTAYWQRQVMIALFFLSPFVCHEFLVWIKSHDAHYHAEFAERVQRLSSKVEEQCGYKVEYILEKACYPTSSLRLCPVEEDEEKVVSDGLGSGDCDATEVTDA